MQGARLTGAASSFKSKRKGQKSGQMSHEQHRISYAAAAKNLTETVNEERNWKSIAVALLVILVICALIIIAIVFSRQKNDEVSYGRHVTFDEVFNASYQAFDLRSQWVGDILCYRGRDGHIVAIDPVTNVTTMLLDAREFGEKSVTEFSVSSNFKYVALKWNAAQKFRHSRAAVYTIYDLATLTRMNVVPPGVAPSVDVQLQFFEWSKSNKSDALIFVYKNNIYYKPSAFSNVVTQVTNTGVENRIFNGIPDWLYEEEIISGASMLWWSQNISLLAYAQLNDSLCSTYDMQRYNNASQIYPYVEQIPYPKAGEIRDNNIPAVTINVHNLEKNTKLATFKAPEELIADTNYLFTGAAWFDDDALLIEWANRVQTKSVAFVCRISTQLCRRSLQVTAIPIDVANQGSYATSRLFGWVDTESRKHIPVTPVGDQQYPYITTALHATQYPYQADVHRQISFIGGLSRTADVLPRVTPLSIDTEVDELLAVDNIRRIAYYIAPRDDDPKTAHLFGVSWKDVGEGAERAQTPRCLTCALSETCDVVNAKFSKSTNYYLLQCNGPDVPSIILRQTNAIDNPNITVLESNQLLRNFTKVVMMPRMLYQKVELEDGRKLEVELMVPPALNEQHFIPHPLLVPVYAGPDSRAVMRRWKPLNWLHYLVTVHDVVVAAVDGRGTSGRGRKNAYWLHKSLGTHEIRDQVLAIQALKKFSYIDKAKIGVTGSSYGGYATLNILSNASETVPCGISLAPVTDWSLYDTAYTERYMGLYKDNILEYKRGSILQSAKIEGIKKTVLFLAHGTADDNVHLQHSMLLVRLLNEAEVQYDMHMYTDRAHNLRGGPSGRQLATKMMNFLLDCYSNKTAARVIPEEFSKFDEELDG